MSTVYLLSASTLIFLFLVLLLVWPGSPPDLRNFAYFSNRNFLPFTTYTPSGRLIW